MDEGLVSIIMPAYNAANTITDSINSVLKQTYTNWELIIIDDCSTDNTLNIVRNFEKLDNRIKVLQNESNLKVAKSRNKGMEIARGEFIAFLDSDDMWTVDKLKKQLGFMIESNVSFSYTNVYVINDNGKKKKKIHFDNKVDYKKLLKSNQISCLTVMIKTEITQGIRMKDIGHEDYLYWLELLKRNNISAYNTNEVLAYYRVSDNSLSSNKLKAAKWQWNIYRNELKLSLISSVLNFVYYVTKGILKRL